jgi:hypothetical protein
VLPFHPYANIFPLIEGDAFVEFCESIRSDERLHDKIVMLDGQILDGRNRYRACTEVGVTPHFRTFNPEVEGDPLTFVISKNLHRRHLDDRQRASVAGEIAKLGRGRPPVVGEDNPPIGGFSAEQAGAMVNVAPRQVERARVVHDQGVPELRDAFRRGDIPVSVAEKIARLPEEIQPEAVAKVLPNGARAIMGSRQEPSDSLDYFPTPPWATRALCEHVLPRFANAVSSTAWEPACGEGHIAEVLREYFRHVQATDIHDYGYGLAQLDFLDPRGTGADGRDDWIITNPPFGDKTEAFVLRSLELARVGVAMFVRMQWLETIGRYERLFKDKPPTLIAFFCERVNLCKGRWEPEGGTATAYIWLVWTKAFGPQPPFWIPPGCKRDLSRPDDAERFTAHPVIKAKRDSSGAVISHDEDGVIQETPPQTQGEGAA